MKLIKLPEYPMENFSAEGQIVCEFFGGSGSALICAEAMKRRARIMELYPAYCDVIARSWVQHRHTYGQPAIVLFNGESSRDFK